MTSVLELLPLNITVWDNFKDCNWLKYFLLSCCLCSYKMCIVELLRLSLVVAKSDSGC